MRRPRHRFRQSLAAVATLSAAIAVLPAGNALAAGGSDVIAYLQYTQGQGATGSPADMEFGVATNGPDDASDVTVQFGATGGTIGSITPDNQASAGTPSCNVTTLTCTIPSLSYVNSDYVVFDLAVSRSTDGTATVTEQITGSGTTDPDTSSDSNTASADMEFISPPASTITNVSATPDPDEDGVTIKATLEAGGAPVDDENLEVYAKPQGASDSSYVDLGDLGYSDDDGVHHGVAHIDVQSYFDADGNDRASALQGPVTFKIEHLADVSVGESSATVNVIPRPVDFSLTVPAAVTYEPGGYVTVTGSVMVAGKPSIPLAGALAVESRPAGSSGPWRAWTDQVAPDKFKTELPAAVNTDFRLRYIADGPGSGSGTSGPQPTDVKQRVKTRATPRILPPHSTATLTAAIGPADAGGQAMLQKRVGNQWRTVAHRALSSHSTAAWPLKFARVATATYRVVTSGTAHNTANAGPTTPIIVERHAGGSPSQHTFLYQTGTGHARWNPCKPIPYWFNAKEAPAGGVAAAKEALRRISQITKLHFVAKGTTHEVPQFGSDQHHKLIIAWVRPGQTNYPIGGGTIGVGGGEASGYTAKDTQVVSGYAVLDSTAKLAPGFGAGTTEGELLLHELGHMTGLDHVNATSQIMYPILDARPAAIYGAGDYHGLQLLGRSQGCIAKFHPPRHARAHDGQAPSPRVVSVFAR